MGTTIAPYGNAFDVLMPGAVMAVVPIVILYLFAQKTFIAGLTAGSQGMTRGIRPMGIGGPRPKT